VTMHVGLILINNGIGGTEKRFGNLFRYLSQNSRHTYTLVLPVVLFDRLREQGILEEGQPGVMKLFTRAPYSLYNRTPLRVFGHRVPGLVSLLGPLWRRELRSPAMARVFDGFDLIHYALPFNLLAPLPNRPVVLEAQDSTFEFLKKSKLTQEGLKGHAFFNCASERICAEYRKHALGRDAEDRLHVSPCSFIDYAWMFVAPKERMITFVGSIERIKNPDLFVDVIYRVAQVRQDFSAYMLGAGRRKPWIDRLIEERGLRQFLVRRFDPHPERVLARSLVFTSLQESDNYHSQALMEAMACGCAIVASDVGETWRLVSEQVGFRVPLQVDAITERLLYLLDNVDVATKMGQAAREKVMREQNISVYVDYLERLYEHVFRVFHERGTRNEE